MLETRIPPICAADDWFSFSTRAGHHLQQSWVKPDEVRNYDDLAKPALKGKLCSRSGSHPHNLSLARRSSPTRARRRTEEWARGMVANFARAQGRRHRPDQGGGGGRMSGGVVEHLLRGAHDALTKPEDQKLMDKVGVVWPNQASTGTHINVSGAGVLNTRRTRMRR